LENVAVSSRHHPVVSAKAIDGAAIVHMIKPNNVKTFGEYAANNFNAYVKKIAQNVDRVDIVFDRYLEGSLKRETREQRGNGIRVSVKESTPIWSNWSQFLKNDSNKTELFQLLAQNLVTGLYDKQIVATKDKEVLSNFALNTESINPCNQEEADSRLFLHVKDMSVNGHKKVQIKTVDTDVVVIAVTLFKDLGLEELWIEFGTGVNQRWLPIHEYHNNIGEEKCQALAVWFAFTGCDTVSAFCGKGKKIAWNTWKSYPAITETFTR
jgi:hypothetical protein